MIQGQYCWSVTTTQILFPSGWGGIGKMKCFIGWNNNWISFCQISERIKTWKTDEKTKPIKSYGTFDLDHKADPSHAQTSGNIITQRNCLYEFVERACMHAWWGALRKCATGHWGLML